MRVVVIIDGVRTAFGKRGGVFRTLTPSDLAGKTIKGLCDKTGILEKAKVDSVFAGCAWGDIDCNNFARYSMLKAGLPYETSATYIEMQCGSSIACINNAALQIAAGVIDVAIAGGAETHSTTACKFPTFAQPYREEPPKAAKNRLAPTDDQDISMIEVSDGMAKKWGKLRYVEICSGPGRCCTRNCKEQDGTALSIVKNEHFDLLSDALFIDYSTNVIDILSKRIESVGKTAHAHAIVGDYNDQTSIIRALEQFSPESLTLCFIDPTDCSVPFETVRSIFQATRGRCDMLISFFDGLDFHRNAVNATLNKSFARLQAKYARFLGTPDFFTRKEIVEAAQTNRYSDLSMQFRQHYSD